MWVCFIDLHITLLGDPYYPYSGRGIVFDRFVCLFVCLFIYFFVSKITRKQLYQFAWNFQRRCGVTMGQPDSILGQFGETARCRDANFFVSNIRWRCGVTTGQSDYIFGQFRETTRCHDAQHGGGVCCTFTPQLVFSLWLCLCVSVNAEKLLIFCRLTELEIFGMMIDYYGVLSAKRWN